MRVMLVTFYLCLTVRAQSVCVCVCVLILSKCVYFNGSMLVERKYIYIYICKLCDGKMRLVYWGKQTDRKICFEIRPNRNRK